MGLECGLNIPNPTQTHTPATGCWVWPKFWLSLKLSHVNPISSFSSTNHPLKTYVWMNVKQCSYMCFKLFFFFSIFKCIYNVECVYKHSYMQFKSFFSSFFKSCIYIIHLTQNTCTNACTCVLSYFFFCFQMYIQHWMHVQTFVHAVQVIFFFFQKLYIYLTQNMCMNVCRCILSNCCCFSNLYTMFV